MADTDIAVVGMACRFPGAPNVESYWKLLSDGVEAIRVLQPDELRAAGVPDERQLDPNFVPVTSCPDGVDQFDASFFGWSPKDAAIMDPQHRVFLEVAWRCFEHAGHAPRGFDGAVGVFAGSGVNTYMLQNLLADPDLLREVGWFLLRHTGNDKDFLATRVSYEFDLRGPSINVQTACSSSLVAIHMAAQSLLSMECDMALAGASTIEVPLDQGYTFRENEILAPDGHCRAFDRDAAGTIFGNGAGAVLLRRLDDAIADGDTIWAVIKGSAVNNDGGRKVGYLAPSVDGHAEVVAEALSVADLTADTIGYVEGHGTGTPVGDPIEVQALATAFRNHTDKVGFCTLGSVKPNLGHLDTAAGVASFIKAVLAVHHGVVPPTLHFREPNPLLEIERTPFVVSAARREWTVAGPRRAGVSSLGVGGTNAHVVLEQAPQDAVAPRSVGSFPADISGAMQLLPVSAVTEAAVGATAGQLGKWFDTLHRGAQRGDVERGANFWADAGWTLARGRASFAQRIAVAAVDGRAAAAALEECQGDTGRVVRATNPAPGVVFSFPGGGAQHVGMARELVAHQPVFRSALERCLVALVDSQPVRDALGLGAVPSGSDVASGGDAAASAAMARPTVGLPALFAIEYALATLWLEWGVEPSGMIGHSLGEYTCAAVAGVLSPEDAMRIVHLRGELFERLGTGAMVSVPLSEKDVRPLLDDQLAVAAINAPELCVVSGTVAAVAALEQRLAAQSVESRRLHIDAAAHSHLLEPLLESFRAGLRGVTFSAPQRRFASNLTGTWITDAEATDREYWVRHLRHSVRFSDGLAAVLQGEQQILLEIGPGQTLTSLSRLHPDARRAAAILPSLPHPKETADDQRHALEAAGRLWGHGIELDWDGVNRPVWGDPAGRRRIPMAGYAFQRQRHWIDARVGGKLASASAVPRPERRSFEDWFEAIEWRPAARTESDVASKGTWLVLCNADGVGDSLVQSLRFDGAAVAAVRPGKTLDRLEHGVYKVPPAEPGAWTALIEMVRRDFGSPTHIAHLWLLDDDTAADRDRALAYGTGALLHLVQALAHVGEVEGLHLGVATHGAVQVQSQQGEAEFDPGPVAAGLQATVHGVCRVVSREYPGIRSVVVDLSPVDSTVGAAALRLEIEDPVPAGMVAHRSGGRFEAHPVPAAPPMEVADSGGARLRHGGTYIITGGLGGVGLVMARHLASQYGANLVLVGRTELPPKSHWAAWCARRGDDPLTETLRAVQAMERSDPQAGNPPQGDSERQRGAVEVVAADVSTARGWREVLDRAAARFGAIHGIVHGAGLIDDGLIHNKTWAQVERVLAPKIDGALALDRAWSSYRSAHPDQPPLDVTVVFSSTSAQLGLPGQIDYAAANAFLDGWAIARSRAGEPTLATDWGIWHNLGMVADHALRLLPPTRGEDSLDQLLGRWERREGGGVQFVRACTPDDWAFAEHKLPGGPAVFPGAGYLDLMAAALRRGTASSAVAVVDVRLLLPLVLAEGESCELSVALVPLGAPGQALRVELWSERGGERRLHAWGMGATAAGRAASAPLSGPIEPGASIPLPQQAVMEFGPRWQCLRVRQESGEADGAPSATVSLSLDDEFAGEAVQHALHPALLDATIGAALPLLGGFGEKDSLFVPAGCGRCTSWGAIPARVHARITVVEDDGSSGSFRITFFDEDGVPVAELARLTLVRLPASREVWGQRPAAEGPVLPEPPPPDLGLEKVRGLAAQGIRAEEGGLALERALAIAWDPSGERRIALAQVMVAPVEREETLRWLGLLAAPRPQGASPADAGSAAHGGGPRDDVELALCGFWRELLGLQDAGLEDDFFQSGGHSLIAVRLFAKVNKAFGVDLELATLFAAPTPGQLAGVLRGELGLPEPSANAADFSGASDVTPAEDSRAMANFQHLVPIQRNGGKPPLYVVHGSGGNVLGFRDLAQRLGSDQPVWGLQARGVDGKSDPHETLDEMARDYADEVLRMQPSGPYYLSGYSGGGAVAYEMAQRLTAAGHEVAIVAMLDTFSPFMKRRSKAKRLLAHVTQLLRHGPGRHIKVIRQKLEGRKVRQRFREHVEQNGDVIPHDLRGHALTDAFVSAFVKYRPQPYRGPVVLFRALEQEIVRYEEDRKLGWGGLATDLTVLDIPGNHDNLLLEPQVPVLCRLMRQELQHARERSAQDTLV